MIKARLLLLIPLLLVTTSTPASASENYAAADSQGMAELNLGELQFYQSDFFPLSMAERGRQNAATWRGMPPGFLEYSFNQIRLVHPLWGYWDNQVAPFEITRQRLMSSSAFNLQLMPASVREGGKPVSRVAYSQDFLFGLSYLDINLSEYYRPGSYFRLGGSNFLNSGLNGTFTSIQVNTYRGQFHHQLSEKLSLDLWYLQLRHRFRLGTFPFFSDVPRDHRIGQVGWISVNWQPDSLKHLRVTPYGYKWGDRYRRQDFSLQRKTELWSAGLNASYRQTLKWGQWSIDADLVRHKITEALHFSTRSQQDGWIKGALERKWRSLRISASGGFRNMEEVGGSPSVSGGLELQAGKGWTAAAEFGYQPQNLPLAALFWNDDSIRSLQEPEVPIREGVTGSLQWKVSTETRGSLKIFYHRFRNGWDFSVEQARFRQKDFENRGLNARLATRLFFFTIRNDLTLNRNYRDSFGPQVNNVLILLLPINLFNNALRLDGYGIYHFIGKWRQVEFDPFSNQYRQSDLESGNHHLLDFKILAHIKTATLFFVWENILSHDYELVSGYPEFFRQFRFGIYWTLFD